MSKETQTIEEITNTKYGIYTVLGVVFFVLIIVGGTAQFAFTMAEKIKDRNELRELQKEKLQLEIKLKKKQLENDT